MNMVVIRHPQNTGGYLFKVPDGVSIDVGTLVNCETCRGVQPGVCITPSFNADPNAICKLYSTSEKQMKRIISIMVESFLEWPDEPVQDTPECNSDD